MKQTSASQKATQRTPQAVDQAPSAGSKGMAIAPPAYGIDSVDEGLMESQAGSGTVTQRRVDIADTGADAEARSENKTGLPDNLKAGIESLSGLAMDDVRVHYNSAKPAQLQALAYTQGTEIHVAPGQEKYLPHEAWHVVQQAQGRVQPTMQLKGGVSVNDDEGLENEAEVMGARAAVVGQRAVPSQLVQSRAEPEETHPESSGISDRSGKGTVNFLSGDPPGVASSPRVAVRIARRVAPLSEPAQMKVIPQDGAWKYDPRSASTSMYKIHSVFYEVLYNRVDQLPNEVSLVEENIKGAAATFNPVGTTRNTGKITVSAIDTESEEDHQQQYNERIANLSHELQHAIDYYVLGIDSTKAPQRPTNEQLEKALPVLHTEFRAWAAEAVAAYEMMLEGQEIKGNMRKLAGEFARGKDQLSAPTSVFFERVRSYLISDCGLPNPTDAFIKKILSGSKDEVKNWPYVEVKEWFDQAIDLFNRFKAIIGVNKRDAIVEKMVHKGEKSSHRVITNPRLAKFL